MKYEKSEMSFIGEMISAMLIIFCLVVLAMIFYLNLPTTVITYPDIAYDMTECHNCTESTPPIPVKRKFEDLIKKKKDR